MTRSPFQAIRRRTEELNKWISKVKHKKSACAHKKQRNLLVYAVLSNSLKQLKRDLKVTQEARRRRWRAFNKPLDETPKTTKPPAPMENEESEPINNWDPEICEELNRSIGEFMSKLKEIKSPLKST